MSDSGPSRAKARAIEAVLGDAARAAGMGSRADRLRYLVRAAHAAAAVAAGASDADLAAAAGAESSRLALVAASTPALRSGGVAAKLALTLLQLLPSIAGGAGEDVAAFGLVAGALADLTILDDQPVAIGAALLAGIPRDLAE